MIRYINCFRKLADISAEDFRRFWNNAEFDGLIRQVSETSGAVSCSKNLTLQVGVGNILLLNRGLGTPFDGTVEYFWDSAHHLQELCKTPEAQALQERMKDYQQQFIDMAASTAFFTEYPAG